MSTDWSKYNRLEDLEKDIKEIVVQGATNVAIATIRGMEMAVADYRSDEKNLLDNVLSIGERLATSRKNEPLARNAVSYLKHMYNHKYDKLNPINRIGKINSDYLNLLEISKGMMVKFAEKLPQVDNAFTHCHSSTVEKILIGLDKKNKDFQVACSETRPLYQGRITAKNLIDAHVKTTLVVDSSAAAFVADRSFFPIDMLFIGADEITAHGDLINKVGSFGIALAANYSNTPVYVVASLLKMNPKSTFKPVEIELRSPMEVWENPPKGLSIYNPAFDLVPNKLITGYITEVGIIKPQDMLKKLHETYEFVF